MGRPLRANLSSPYVRIMVGDQIRPLPPLPRAIARAKDGELLTPASDDEERLPHSVESPSLQANASTAARRC